MIESSIDMANTYAWIQSNKTVSKAVPLSLRWKIELFARIHRDVPELHHLRHQAEEIVPLIKELEEDRHWMAHGMLMARESKPGSWLLKKGVFLPDGDFKIATRRFTRADLSKIQNRLIVLGAKVTTYSFAIAAKMRKDVADNKFR